LTGKETGIALRSELATHIPDARTYVLLLVDGLGIAQLDHPAAESMNAAKRGMLHAPFPTTTSVSLATVATGRPPSEHGLVSHLAWLEEAGGVVNTLKWVDMAGLPVTHDYASVLPKHNLWERLRAAGIEPITVQPGSFEGTPLSRLLYRGARFEPTWDTSDLIDATVQMAESGRRFIFTYVWQVDFAAHVNGLGSSEFHDAMTLAARVWDDLDSRLPADVALIGTADHGLVEFSEDDKILVRDKRYDPLRFAGDPRGVLLWGERLLIDALRDHTGGTLVDPIGLIGPNPSAAARRRLGHDLLVPPEGKVILPPGFDKRLRCYHGGVSRAEIEIPLLVR
ncbi:MAG TPA: alkaline phosphatase family protein, partial [Acidimicrobiia bacterium]|nr:alkaline phosphatase family protein [Acidimicrobiia bacterium]